MSDTRGKEDTLERISMKENYHNMSVPELEAKRNALVFGRKYEKPLATVTVAPLSPEPSSVSPVEQSTDEEADIFDEGPVLEKIFEKAHKRVLSIQPQLEEFGAVRNPAQLEEAREKIKRKKYYIDTHNTERENHQSKISTITEALFTDGVSRYRWLGEGMESYVVSLYDDYFNNIDGVVRFTREQDTFEGFAVDLHCGLNEETLQKKFSFLVGDIMNGRVSKLDFLLDDNEEPFEPIEIPKFIIAIPSKDAKELFALWQKNDTEALKAHPIKSLIMQQIVAQADALCLVAQRSGREDLVKVFNRIVSYINNTAVSHRQDLKQAIFDEHKNSIVKRMRNMITKAEYDQTKKAA